MSMDQYIPTLHTNKHNIIQMTTTTMTTTTMTTSHGRICGFYAANPSIDFETVNLLIVDMLDKLMSHVSDTSTAATTASLFAQWMTELKTSVTDLKETVSSIQADTTDHCMVQMMNFRKEYIDELNMIVNHHTTEKIRPLLEKNNHELLEKTERFIRESTAAQSNGGLHQIQESIRFFHKSISDDTRQLIKSMDNNHTNTNLNNDIIQEFIAKFEHKSVPLWMQPVCDMIASSEERIQSSLTSASISKDSMILQEMNDFLQKYKTSHTTNAHAGTTVHRIQVVLNQVCPTAEVVRISRPLGKTTSAHAFVLKRPEGKPQVLIEHKDISENMGEDDLQLFLQDVDHHCSHGIFLSAQSGFTNKANYQIESHHGYLIMYVHDVEYNPDKIRIAINVLDHLSAKWKECGSGSNGENVRIHIDTEMLEKINQEYQAFVTQKETVVQVLKDNHRKVIAQMDDLRLPILDQYLSTKFVSTSQKPGLLCNMCKHYYANNLKALAAHKRGCARKQTVAPVTFSANTMMVTAV